MKNVILVVIVNVVVFSVSAVVAMDNEERHISLKKKNTKKRISLSPRQTKRKTFENEIDKLEKSLGIPIIPTIIFSSIGLQEKESTHQEEKKEPPGKRRFSKIIPTKTYASDSDFPPEEKQGENQTLKKKEKPSPSMSEMAFSTSPRRESSEKDSKTPRSPRSPRLESSEKDLKTLEFSTSPRRESNSEILAEILKTRKPRVKFDSKILESPSKDKLLRRHSEVDLKKKVEKPLSKPLEENKSKPSSTKERIGSAPIPTRRSSQKLHDKKLLSNSSSGPQGLKPGIRKESSSTREEILNSRESKLPKKTRSHSTGTSSSRHPLRKHPTVSTISPVDKKTTPGQSGKDSLTKSLRDNLNTNSQF